MAQKTEWEQVYKGTQKRANQLKVEYRNRGYFVRVRKYNNGSYYTLEISEAKEWNFR